jgi:hypothetical protein
MSLMAEMARASKNHGNTMLIGGRDNLIIPHAATGLNNATSSGSYNQV